MYNGSRGYVAKELGGRGNPKVVELPSHLKNLKHNELEWTVGLTVIMTLDCEKLTVGWEKRDGTREENSVVFGSLEIPKGKTWYPFMRCTRNGEEKFQIME